jgi:hypothetical protein
MLSLYALVRFALSGSPFRERRELLFRRNKPNNAYEDELEAARNQEGNLDIEARRRLRQERLGSGRSVESVVSEQRLDILKSLGAVDFQRISQTITSEMAKSPEVFTTLLLQEETLRDVDVQSIAESVGIQGLTVLDKDSPNTSILQQILDKNLATSTREALVEKLLQTSPRVTAVFTRAMISRLSVYEEQMQRIESRLKILPGIPSIDRIRKIVEGNQVEAEVERMLREQGKERDKNQRRYLTGCITEAYRAYERIREFGGLYWSGARVSRVEDDAQRAEYLGNLRKQTRELNQLLGLQIQLETDKAQDHLASIAADAYARAGGEGALSEDHLENAYRPLNEPFLEIQRTQRDQQGRYRSTEDDPLFLEEQQEIFLSSELQLRRLRSGQEATEAAAARWKENPFSEVRETQEEMKQWAGRCLALIRAIKAQKTFSQHPPLIQERLG